MIALIIALQLSDVQVVARTLHAEAGGESRRGVQAVAGVIGNRALLRKTSARKVCLQKFQFSCWNNRTIPRPKLTPKYQECIDLARKTVSGDVRNNFTHYYAYRKCNPAWARELKNKTTIGNHAFGTILPKNRSAAQKTKRLAKPKDHANHNKDV